MLDAPAKFARSFVQYDSLSIEIMSNGGPVRYSCHHYCVPIDTQEPPGAKNMTYIYIWVQELDVITKLHYTQ